MLVASKSGAGRLRAASIACLVASSAGAVTTNPLVQCQPANFDGVSVCAVNMDSYAQLAGQEVMPCPAGVTSSRESLLCEQTFAAAVEDARLYFGAPDAPSQPYLIQIAAGSYDFSVQTKALRGQIGAIDVTGIAPASAGCLAGRPADTGIVDLSGNPCLIISGAGPDQTTLITANSLTGIAGKEVSHIMIENMAMVQPNRSTTQGTYVSFARQSIDGVDFPTLTLDIAAGLPTPLELFQINCVNNGPQGCTTSGLKTIKDDIYMRVYTNSVAPALIQSTSGNDVNAQLPWGYPTLNGKVLLAARPTQPEPVNFPNRWTVTLSRPPYRRAIPSYYSGTTAGVPNLICMKVDHANAFWFGDNQSSGTDIIMNDMVWVGAARGTFRGIRGLPAGGGLGAQIYNSTIERGPPVGGQTPCLATQSGGMQFGQPGDPPIYGNAVYGLRADGTGDDSIAMFNDIGGTRDSEGNYYPQSSIRQSAIGNSFARDIYLENVRDKTRLAGKSPVLVDLFTQSEINNNGNCDPLVMGNGNCPVTYSNQ
jgi:hypothetical protein